MRVTTSSKQPFAIESDPTSGASGRTSQSHRFSRRRFIGAASVGGAAFAFTRFSGGVFAAVPVNDLITKAATELGKMIKRKEVSSSELVEAYLKQIEKVNPKI